MEEQRKKASNGGDFYADTMELDKRRQNDFAFMNRERGIFAGQVSEGLNRCRSVFDRTALFHTGSGEN